jgi:hypothetical protein
VQRVVASLDDLGHTAHHPLLLAVGLQITRHFALKSGNSEIFQIRARPIFLGSSAQAFQCFWASTAAGFQGLGLGLGDQARLSFLRRHAGDLLLEGTADRYDGAASVLVHPRLDLGKPRVALLDVVALAARGNFRVQGLGLGLRSLM